jgi:hypothetical protein
MKEHIYKENKIIEYPDGRFLATWLNEDDEVMSLMCSSLEVAKKVIDNECPND